MSGTPHPQVDPRMIEQTRKHINRLREEVARLSEMDIGPSDYFGEFLTRVLQALAAPAGAIWLRTPHGNLQLQAQVQLQRVGIDRTDAAKEMHTELLRQAVQQPRPLAVPPQSNLAPPQGTGPAPGNPTDYMLLLVPILTGNQVAGLIEVWQDPARHPSAVQGFVQFLVHMAELASRYLRNRLLGEMMGQQELWTKMEVFSRQIHESLHPVEVAYRIANEGRRLVDCDRVSIGVRYGKRVVVEAVSGADVVEKRSNLVQRMRALFERVLDWGEKLVYTGTKDDTLPPAVLKALDAYLEESNSKMLSIMPLRDERESSEDGKIQKQPRSVMMVECFETAAAADPVVARQQVLARHAASALYNSVEHRRIPFRFVWLPIARVQEGLGGKTRAIVYGILAGLLLLAVLMYFVPYPLKMDATGQLVPVVRGWVFSPVKGRVDSFQADPGTSVGENQNLVLMYDHDLQIQLEKLLTEIRAAEQKIGTLTTQLSTASVTAELAQLQRDLREQEDIRTAKAKEYSSLVNATNSVPERPGYFWLKSPPFPADGPAHTADARWIILNWDYKEKFKNAGVRPTDPLLRLGYPAGNWEVELKVPQKHIGQVLQALERLEQEKRTKIVGVLEKAIGSGWQPSKHDLARWSPERDRASKEEIDELVARESVDQLLRKVWLSDLQIRSSSVLDRAVEEKWLTAEERAELGKEPELDVDLLVKSAPTEVFKGKLARSKIAGAADQHRDENNEAEPVVVARVRISGEGIAEDDQIPQRLLLTDTQVSAKVRCGNHRMGYSLFYGVWEFFYEKVVFFF